MTEPIKTATPEVYANEAKYMEALREHSEIFDKLVEFVQKIGRI